LEPENDVMKREDLAELAKTDCSLVRGFPEAIASETVDIEPLYPPFDLETPRT